MQKANFTLIKKMQLSAIAIIFLGFSVKLAGNENSALALVYFFLLCLLSIFAIFKSSKVYRVNSSYSNFKILMLNLGLFFIFIILRQILELVGIHTLINAKATFFEIAKLLGILAAFIIGYKLSQDKDAAKNLIELLLFAGGLYAFFSIILYCLQNTGLFTDFVTENNNLVANFANKSNAAIFFSSIGIFAYTRLLRRFIKTKKFEIINSNNLIPLLAFIFSYIALLLTGASKTTGAFNIAIIFCSLFNFRDQYPLWYYLLINLFVWASFSIIGFIFNHYVIPDDFTNYINNFSLRSLNNNAQQILVGSGFGSIDSVIANLSQTNHLITKPPQLNIIKTWYIESGLFGILLMCVINFFAILPIFRHIIIGKPNSSILIGIVCVYILFILSGLSFFDFKEPAIIGYFAVLVGAGVSLSVTRSA